jgi:DNA-binding LytR/AlgR family response regulator
MRESAAIGGAETWARWLTWATVAGIALGVAGPFGSYLNAGTVTRIAYWTGMLWAGTVVLGLTVGTALRLSTGGRLPLRFVAGAATLAGCAPLAGLAAVVGSAVWGPQVTNLSALDWYAQTLFVSAPLVAGVLWFETRRSRRKAQAGDQPEAEGASAGRLSPRQRAEALCLQMEDHYVRVHTPGRSELVLLPMHRALEEIGERPGLRVHRSWWVAQAAVERVEQEGRSVWLVLANGLRVPVARNRVAELRARGWAPAP